MRSRLCWLPLAAFLLLGCGRGGVESTFTSDWSDAPDRRWVGADYWANRLQDWTVREGRLECVLPGPMRTVHLLTRRLESTSADFRMSAVIGRVDEAVLSPSQADGGEPGARSAGFLLAAGPGLDYRSAALIHHSPGEGGGFYAGIDESGALFFRSFEGDGETLAYSEERLESTASVELVLAGVTMVDGYVVELSARSAGDESAGVGPSRVYLRLGDLEGWDLTGGLALVSHGACHWFREWRLEGMWVEAHPERALGPVIGTQHTLDRGTLKLTAQLAPLGADDEKTAEFQLRQGGRWSTTATTGVVEPGYTATFRIEGWDASSEVPYRILYNLRSGEGVQSIYYEGGVIRREPVGKEEIVVATFTGNHNVAPGGVGRASFPWSWGVYFPHADIVGHVSAHAPDFLFFSGDQVYEGASPTRADFQHPYEDYLYKWYLWVWAFRDLTASIPSVTVPDDHDVFHGNIWGAGGIATPPGLSGASAQDAGGYKLPPDWVNMVERTMTSHLPDPYNPEPLESGIGVYYTDILYGGVSFAVVEDRKFKSAPAGLLPEARIVNGWPQNLAWNPKTQGDAPGAELLGDRQLAFLEEWAADWSDGAWMKVLLSQSLFSNVATIPEDALSGAVIPSLPTPEPGEYPQGQKIVSDFDSHGWPQSGRNQAIRAMRKGFAVHLSGDQHLGSTVQYGVEDWRDSGYALCVPSVANFWPRRWFPPYPGANRDPKDPPYTGDYEDGFGNKVTVYAVANPVRSGHEPAALHDRAPGYGIARLNRTSREVSLEVWPRWAHPGEGEGPLPGWPVTFHQSDNYSRQAEAHLPWIDVTGMEEPVIHVIRESSEEVVYTIRIREGSFHPKVFALGSYTVIVGEPGTERVRTLEGLEATATGGERIRVEFQ